MTSLTSTRRSLTVELLIAVVVVLAAVNLAHSSFLPYPPAVVRQSGEQQVPKMADDLYERYKAKWMEEERKQRLKQEENTRREREQRDKREREEREKRLLERQNREREERERWRKKEEQEASSVVYLFLRTVMWMAVIGMVSIWGIVHVRKDYIKKQL